MDAASGRSLGLRGVDRLDPRLPVEERPVHARGHHPEAVRAEIPDDFDWSYYQSAPLDQQIERLDGDEWILLQGLDAELIYVGKRCGRHSRSQEEVNQLLARLAEEWGLVWGRGLPGGSASH